jgi:hypothetical protein
MKRREFITLLGGAAAAWPLAARGRSSRQCRWSGFSARATDRTALALTSLLTFCADRAIR